MIRITKEEKEMLEKAKLLKYKTKTQEPNIYIANKTHKAKRKTYYVVEEYKILAFLGKIKGKKK